MTQGEMRLEGVINHVLRRRILRSEQQLIPQALRSLAVPSERADIDESTFCRHRQQAAPPEVTGSLLHPWQQGYGGRQMPAIPEMPVVAGRGFHYQDSALLSGQQMPCWPAWQEGLGTSSEARSRLAGTTTQEVDLTAAVAGLLGALATQEDDRTAAVAGLLGALARPEPAIHGISKQNQHPSHWMPVFAGRHFHPGGAGLSGQQMYPWPALQVGLGTSSEAPSRSPRNLQGPPAGELQCAATLSLLAQLAGATQQLDRTAAVAGLAGDSALSEGSILGKRGSVDSMQPRRLLTKAQRRRGQDEQAWRPPGGEAGANVTGKDMDDSMPPDLEELEVAAAPPASAPGESMLPGRQQAARLEALLLAKLEYDTALGIIEQCVATGVLSRSQAAAEIAEAAAALQRAKDKAGLGSADGGAQRDMQANVFTSLGCHRMVAGESAQCPTRYSQQSTSVVEGGYSSESTRGRQVGSKNTPRSCIDDLSDDTLEALGRELGLAASGREELLAGIHKASGATSKVPKTSLDQLSLATLQRICANRRLSPLGDKSKLIQRIQQVTHSYFLSYTDIFIYTFCNTFDTKYASNRARTFTDARKRLPGRAFADARRRLPARVGNWGMKSDCERLSS
jgi:hypothetical protein